jgi:hypothetical protein
MSEKISLSAWPSGVSLASFSLMPSICIGAPPKWIRICA